MEVPVINRLSNFDGGVTCLQSPSFLSQILSVSTREKLFQTHTFWTWSAFIIAAIASVGAIINRIRVLVIRFQCYYYKPSASSEPLLSSSSYDDASDYSDDDNEDDDDDEAEDDAVSWSSSSSISDLDLLDDDDYEPAASSLSPDDEDFHVRGSGYYHDHGLIGQGQNRNSSLRRRRSSSDGRRFSWSDFSSSKSVVKLWDSWGLGFDRNGADERYPVPAIATPSASTFLSAEAGNSGRVRLGVWDVRVGSKIPAMLAEWGPQLGRIVGGGGVVASDFAGKVYVRDDVTDGVTIGDLRNFGSPLKSLTGYGVDESGCDSAVTRCCDAVRSYFL